MRSAADLSFESKWRSVLGRAIGFVDDAFWSSSDLFDLLNEKERRGSDGIRLEASRAIFYTSSVIAKGALTDKPIPIVMMIAAARST